MNWPIRLAFVSFTEPAGQVDENGDPGSTDSFG
jgi:hypothetical protein